MLRLLTLSILFLHARCLIAQDTIPVYQEPYHHLVFQNDAIRILDVRLDPGDTSAWHIHRDAITYIGLEGSRIWLDVPGEHPRSVYLPDDFWGGDVAYSETPFVHRIANIGFQQFRLIAIEHLMPRKELPVGYPDLEGWETLDINPYFIVYKTTLLNGTSTRNMLNGPALMICRGNGQLLLYHNETTATMQSGDWRFWPRDSEMYSIENPGEVPMEVLLIHL